MEANTDVSFLVSFMAGIMVFFSPCILPLVPSYLSYLTGISFKELSGEVTDQAKKNVRLVTVFHSFFFVIGFSAVFVLLGMTASFLGNLLLEYQNILKIISGIFIIFFGLVITGFIKIGFLQKDKKIEYKKKGTGYLGSFLVGASFAFAWTPCVGPILGSILVYASSEADIKLGFKLLSVFSLGLALPFFIVSFAVNSFLLYMGKIKKYLRWINLIAGIILVVFGISILMGGIR